MTMLRQDAETNSAPDTVITLTSAAAITDAAQYRKDTAQFWKAFRKRWGNVEYCGFVEWTTGEAPTSGGVRRLHSHWLVKGLGGLDAEGGELAAVEAWVSSQWKRLTGAWVVQVAKLETVGGVVGYLALHHEKMEQAPPPGWTGRRLRPSKRYFATDGRTRRDLARHWLASHRARKAEGELGPVPPAPTPTLVWATTEERKASDAIAQRPGTESSIVFLRRLERQLEDGGAPINRPIDGEDVRRWRDRERRRLAYL